MHMNKKEKMTLVPKLRFPEFLSNGAIVFKHGNLIFEPISNKNHNSDLPVLAITQEYGAIPRDHIDYNVSVTDKSLKSYKVVEIGDFIISLRSFQGGIEYSMFHGICSPAYIILRKKVDIADQYYKYYFKTSRFIQDLNKDLEGIRDGKMVSYSQFSSILIPKPDKKEQQKIADCLSSLDDLIKAENRKLLLLRDHKKGLIQKLFPADGKSLPEWRFPEFRDCGKWKIKPLGAICNVTTGKLDANAMVENGEYRFYTCAKDYYKIDSYAFDTESLLISGNGANVGYIHYFNGKFNAYQRTYVLYNFNENILYVKCFLEKNLSKRIATEKNNGNTPYIVLGTLTDMNVLLPEEPKEQQKIADCLSAFDELINTQSDKIESLKLHKIALMRGLFPEIEEVI